MNIFYKSIILMSFFFISCSSGYSIKSGGSKAQLDVSIAELGHKTGMSSLFAGHGYRLQIHSFDITKCEIKEKVVHVHAMNTEDTIDIPANEPLYLFFFYSSTKQVGGSGGFINVAKDSCVRPIAFLPKENHRYKVDFKLRSNQCIVKIIDLTNRNIKTTMVSTPKACIKHYSIQ